jgi:hypothetical protein
MWTREHHFFVRKHLIMVQYRVSSESSHNQTFGLPIQKPFTAEIHSFLTRIVSHFHTKPIWCISRENDFEKAEDRLSRAAALH